MSNFFSKTLTFWLSWILLALLFALLVSTHWAQTSLGLSKYELFKGGDSGDSNEMAYLIEDWLFSDIKSAIGVILLSLALSWSTAKANLISPTWRAFRNLSFIGLISVFSLAFLSILRLINPVPIWQFQ